MACETLYVHKHVHCGRVGESEPAARGIEIHKILATYLNHLVEAGRATDLEVLDSLMKGAGAEAREVLGNFRDNHAFAPDKILATELHIVLDENFLPIEYPGDDGQIAAHEGTLDLVMLYSLTEAEIEDWKSYYQIIDADTFQSKFYPLLLMCLNPSLERVEFVLEQMIPEQRLRFALWLQEAEKQNTRVLKELIVRYRPIRYRDENQSEYVAGFVAIERKFYPYRDAASIVDEWFRTHPDERGLREKPTISRLSSAIKAEKRAQLAQELADIADVRV